MNCAHKLVITDPNLRVLTDSQHGAIDESFITPREEIKDDQDMIDFIKTVI